MFARMIRMQISAAHIDKAASLFRDSVIPNCKSQKGYRGAYFFADRKRGECVPLTLWESESDMLATEQNRFFQEQLVKFMEFFKEGPVREAFEVIVDDSQP